MDFHSFISIDLSHQASDLMSVIFKIVYPRNYLFDGFFTLRSSVLDTYAATDRVRVV